MREIKFRAWGGEHKENWHFVYFDLLSQVDDWVESSEVDGVTGGYPVMNKKEIVAIQQFTGLKDKNGKEIYEGDIVNCRLFIGDTYTYKYSVEYVKNPFPMFSVNSRQMNDDEYEIIGNIYETPNLLN